MTTAPSQTLAGDQQAESEAHTAFTDAPSPHSNLLLGSLQLVIWLLIHPSAWRHYLARVDETLRDDFTLSMLTRSQWNNPMLRRLLAMGCLVWPAILTVSAVLIMALGQVPTHDIFFTLFFSLVITMAIGIWLNWSVSVVFGSIIVAASAIAVIAGQISEAAGIYSACMAIGLASGVATSLSWQTSGGIPRRTAWQWPNIAISITALVIMAALLLFLLTRLPLFDFKSTPNREGPLGIALGFASCVPFNITVATVILRRVRRWYFTLAISAAIACVGIGMGLLFGMPHDVLLGTVYGLVTAAAYGIFFGMPYAISQRTRIPITAGVAGALGCSTFYIGFSMIDAEHSARTHILLAFASILLGLTLRWWRPFITYPFTLAWDLLLQRLDHGYRGRGPSRLRWHSAFWDELQRLPVIGLSNYVVHVAEQNPEEGAAALRYLAGCHQHKAARNAQVELDVRQLEHCADVQAIGSIHSIFARRDSAELAHVLLGSFNRISLDVETSLKHVNIYHKRLALTNVADHLISLIGELTRSHEGEAVRLLSVASRWRHILKEYLAQLSESVELTQELDNPYVVGVPLNEQQKIFVGRTDISARIEQLLLDQRRPPLLLWGQRRMGKTSLLRNLGRLLPSTTLPLFVDGEAVAGAADYTDLLYNIAREMVKSAREQRNLSLPRLNRNSLMNNPFTLFNEWLDAVEHALEAGQYTALLALDEFEALGNVMSKGRFDDEDILRTLRHLMQHRPKFKVLLASSHSIEEFQHWSSYLINMQVVKLSYLSEEDTRQLTEHPVVDFALRYEPEAAKRVYTLTRGHPTLVQLLCYQIVGLKNEQEPSQRRLATVADVEEAIPLALSSGRFLFSDMQQNQIDEKGVALLRILAMHGEGAVVPRSTLAARVPENFPHTLALLLRRDLIEQVGELYRPTVQARTSWRAQRVPASQLGEGYRFQVELVRRWFAQP